jgi:hypothetical protein
MKLLTSLIVAAVVAIPVAAFAQSSQPVTRAQVRAELVQLEQAGYRPASDRTRYPDNIQATQARLNVASASYGSSIEGASASGSWQATPAAIAPGSTYAHH